MVNGPLGPMGRLRSITEQECSMFNVQCSMFNGLRLHEPSCLLHLQVFQPVAGNLARSAVLLALREELHAEAGDVLGGGELFLALGTLSNLWSIRGNSCKLLT